MANRAAPAAVERARPAVPVKVPRKARKNPPATSHVAVAATARDGVAVDSLPSAIIRSKVEASPVRAQTLTRDRLMAWMDEHLTDRLKLVVAEAGFGKTTLLADFCRRETARCLWYKLESSDREWITFISYLIASFREAEDGFGQATASLIGELTALNPSRDVVAGSLIAEMGGMEPQPTVLLLDDFHLVDENEDVRAIVERLLERAPPWLSFLITSRRRPALRLGRLAAQGDVAELSTADLRFSATETAELFRSTYGLPLEPDLITQVDARTEGWGASLQLLYSSIRSRQPSEVRSFIRQMSGAEGSLYDFLAEEVLGHLDPVLQDVVMRVAILERIHPKYVAALLGEPGQPARLADVSAYIHQAEDLGLLSRSSVRSGTHRMHPLLRDFLMRWLEERTTLAERQQMHRLVAQAAEPEDWLTATRHYIEADDHADAMRTLSDAGPEALANGSWPLASTVLPQIVGVAEPPPVIAIRARALAISNHVEALDLLSALDLASLSPAMRALIRHTMAFACFRGGDVDGVVRNATEILQDPGTPAHLRDIALGYRILTSDRDNDPLAVSQQRMVSAAETQAIKKHHYFAGLSYHNASYLALEQGQYQRCVNLGDLALEQFQAIDPLPPEAQSTHSTLFMALTELGSARADEELRLASDLRREGDADAFAEVASALAILGKTDSASDMAEEARHRATAGRTDLAGAHCLLGADVMILLVAGHAVAARRLLEQPADRPVVVSTGATLLSLKALTALLAGQPDAARIALEGLQLAGKQGAYRVETTLRVVYAVATDDATSLRRAVRAASTLGAFRLLESADAIATGFHLLDPLPEEVEASIRDHLPRWLPVLRRTVRSIHPPNALMAARLLARYGDIPDVPLLVATDKTYRRRLKGHRLARQLLDRVSPTLHIRDLGRGTIEVDTRRVALSEARRRAGALLMYLVTRPQHLATREQVIEDLWPDAGPTAGANSLNQTLYFLRRDIDPWYDEDGSPNYVNYEAEVVWLTPTLVSADSAVFGQAVYTALEAGDLPSKQAAISLYEGRFAPEFEYEEWSLAWRDGLHAMFLSLALDVGGQLHREGEIASAISVCQQALAVDPAAVELEQMLIRLYHATGSSSAAAAQYEHFAHVHRTDLGVDPPTLEELLKDFADGPRPRRRALSRKTY